METDMFVMVAATNLATLTLSTLYYVSRINELRIQHTREKAEINHEHTMLDRLYGAVPMESLIGLETFDAAVKEDDDG